MFKRLRARSILLLVATCASAGALAFAWLMRPSPLFSSLPVATTASFGHAGDPVNVAFVGDEASIIRAFHAARWLVPEPVTAASALKMAAASALDAPYPSAPVSDLRLFGRVQDLAFELPAGSARERHHVRLWRTTMLVSGKPLWIGSASYDSGIELSGTTALPTHHVSPNVDGERDFAARTLADAGTVQTETTARIGYPTLWGFNGGGDWYFDDGLIQVLTLR